MLERMWKVIRGKENERAKRELEEVAALSIDSARRRALELLHNPSLYEIRPASSWSDRQSLGLALDQFFTLFASVEDKRGGTRIGHDYVGVSRLRPPSTRVGEDVEMHFELITNPGDDHLYWLSDAVHELDNGYKTIWHLIVSDE